MKKDNQQTEKSKSPKTEDLEAKSKISKEEATPIIYELIRLSQTAAMATIDNKTNNPYISKVGFMADMQGYPILLLSDLSQHTQNIHKNNSISLLIDGDNSSINLNQPRLTISGKLAKTLKPEDKSRYLNRHRKAFFAEFADFSFYKLNIEYMHFIGGFGTAHTINFNDISFDKDPISDLILAESELLANLNKNQRDVIDKIVNSNIDVKQEGWYFSDLDPEGACFSRRGNIVRVKFNNPIFTKDQFIKWCSQYGASFN